MLAKVTLAAALLAQLLAPASGGATLILGDSSASWSGHSLAQFCQGMSVVQQAVPGSLASEWGAPNGGYCPNDDKRKQCNAAVAFAAKPANYSVNPFTHVWLQVGYIDWMKGHCRGMLQPDRVASLRENVSKAIQNVVDAVPPNLPIFMFEYMKPTMVPLECVKEETYENGANIPMDVSSMLQSFNNMKLAVNDACTNHPTRRCTMLHSNLHGDVPDPQLPTPCVYHRDGLHPNNRGFCTMFTSQEAQLAFGCDNPVAALATDCLSVHPTVPKAPALYEGDAEVHEGNCADYVPYYSPVKFIPSHPGEERHGAPVLNEEGAPLDPQPPAGYSPGGTETPVHTQSHQTEGTGRRSSTRKAEGRLGRLSALDASLSSD